MPNVALIKDNGEPLILPARSITAVMSLENAQTPPDHPDAKSLIYSTFRGFSVFFLLQTGREVWSEAKSRLGAGPEVPMLEMPARGEDATYVLETDITGLEGMREPVHREEAGQGDAAPEAAEPAEERFLRITVRTHSGGEVFTDIAHTEEVEKRLTTLLLEREDDATTIAVPGKDMKVIEIPKRRTRGGK